jgi:hypothetical protein
MTPGHANYSDDSPRSGRDKAHVNNTSEEHYNAKRKMFGLPTDAHSPAILAAHTVAEQLSARIDPNIRHLDDPFPQPLSSRGGVLTEGISLERPRERDYFRSFLRCRRPARLAVMNLKCVDQKHPSYDQPATQLHCSRLSCGTASWMQSQTQSATPSFTAAHAML